jgi:uncharacterized membrane protein
MTRWLVVSIVLTVAAFASVLYLYLFAFDRLPEQVPTHWNIRGVPDQFVPRERVWPYLLLTPGVMALMTLLAVVLPWLSPRTFDPARFRPTWNYLMALVVILFAYIHVALLLATFQAPIDTGRMLVAGIFLFFALMGNSLGKVRRNFWMGIRTPWTLASETVWNRTHRVAAWLWVVTGLVGFGMVLAFNWMIASLVLLLVAAFIPVLYSLILYKRLEHQGKLHDEAPDVTDAVVS